VRVDWVTPIITILEPDRKTSSPACTSMWRVQYIDGAHTPKRRWRARREPG